MTDFAVLLDRLIAERGVSVHELARQVPCSAGHISNLRYGKKQPSATIAERLDHFLEAGGELIRLARRDPAPMGGRSFVDELMNHAIELGKWAEASNVGDVTVEQLDDAIRRVGRDHLSSPLEPLIQRASDISRRILDLLHEHQRLRHTRDLYLIGAKTNAFLAAACGDLGQQGAAAAHARTAFILGQEAGHPGAVALGLSALSKVAFWDDQKQRAAELARRGFEVCPPNSTRVLLACQEADAATVPEAHEAISRAHWADDERSQDDDLPGLYSCGIARRSCYTMTLHLRAGQPAKVLAAAADADGAYRAGEERSYGTWAQVQMSAALAHLGLGSVDGAAARLAPVLALPPEMRLATFDDKLSRTLSLLRGSAYRGSAEARGLAGEIDGYLTERQIDTIPYPLAIESGNRST